MRLLLDHCVDRRLADHLARHDVRTAAQMGWEQLRNGELLTKAAAEGFDALLTTDANLRHQQNLGVLPLSVVVLRAPSNRLGDLVPMVPQLESALANLRRGELRELAAQTKGQNQG